VRKVSFSARQFLSSGIFLSAIYALVFFVFALLLSISPECIVWFLLAGVIGGWVEAAFDANWDVAFERKWLLIGGVYLCLFFAIYFVCLG
jgi:hypothetical protein